MSETQKLAITPRTSFSDVADLYSYHAENLIMMASEEYKGYRLTTEMVLSCRKFEKEDNPLLAEFIKIKLEAREVRHTITTQTLETAKETNAHGVSLDSIKQFADELKYKFGIGKDQVLERLSAALTPEKLKQLIYFQNRGHELDVTGLTNDSKLEFCSCSEIAPKGHRNLNYFDAQDLLQSPEFVGVDFMTEAQCQSLLDQHAVLDIHCTASNLKSPEAGTRTKPGRVDHCRHNSILRGMQLPYEKCDSLAFRVCITV